MLTLPNGLAAEMAIRGVRSFDEKRINLIQFFTPLTVIVGTNGSGKTVSSLLKQSALETSVSRLYMLPIRPSSSA